MQLDSNGNDNKNKFNNKQGKEQTTARGDNRETEPVLAYQEQAMSAEGTTVVLATTTKRGQQHEESESPRAWRRAAGGEAEKRGLSPNGKHPPEEQSQTRKHQNNHPWLHMRIPGLHSEAITDYLRVESKNLNVKQASSIILNSTAHKFAALGLLPWTMSFREAFFSCYVFFS